MVREACTTTSIRQLERSRALSRLPGLTTSTPQCAPPEAAYPAWRAWRPSERARVLRRLGELMERDADEIARLSVLDNGMTAGMSQPLVGIMANWTSYYAGWADKVEGRVTSFPANQRELAYSMPEPYGVVGIILTWNGPVVSVGMKLIPALAAGNAVVMKPSELTPYATEHVMRLVREAGIPDGVVNLVLGGPETGDALVRHPLVQKVSFTGGPSTARRILATCAEVPQARCSRTRRQVRQYRFSRRGPGHGRRRQRLQRPGHISPGRAARLRRACSFTATSTTPSWSASSQWSTACGAEIR